MNRLPGLLPADQLQELIDSFPALDRARRVFLVDFLIDSDQADHLRTFSTYAETFPPDEQAFIKACCGIDDQPPIRKAA